MLAPSKRVQYERLAAKCEQLAARVDEPSIRTGYEFLAQQWRKMAEQEAQVREGTDKKHRLSRWR